MDNFVTIAGNLVKDPETRFTASGDQVTTFRVAVNRRVRGDGTGWESRNDGFYNVSVWRQLAATTMEHLHKGQRVLVHGRLAQHEFTATGGEKRTSIEIEADDVGISLRYASRGPAAPARGTTPTDTERVNAAAASAAPAAEAASPW